MAVKKEIYESLAAEGAIRKGLDVLVLNIQRESKARYGLDIKKKDTVEVIKKLAEERING